MSDYTKLESLMKDMKLMECCSHDTLSRVSNMINAMKTIPMPNTIRLELLRKMDKIVSCLGRIIRQLEMLHNIVEIIEDLMRIPSSGIKPEAMREGTNGADHADAPGDCNDAKDTSGTYVSVGVKRKKYK